VASGPALLTGIVAAVALTILASYAEVVLAAANAGDFGLAATVRTADLGRALRISQALDAGYVQINQKLTIQPNLSYGGFRRPGLGNEASLGSMLEHFTRKKTIAIAMV
jgi:betaine-aldehyde dehydrogenase